MAPSGQCDSCVDRCLRDQPDGTVQKCRDVYCKDACSDAAITQHYFRPAADALTLPNGACQRQGEGCGSCVADGVWGALFIESDCTRHCDKVCGSEPATKGSPIFNTPVKIGVSLATKTEVVGMTADDTHPISMTPSVLTFDNTSTTADVWCGVFGPSQASITCHAPKTASCSCPSHAAGVWGIAKCECQDPAPGHQDDGGTCKVDPHDTGCAAAGVGPVYHDPGCSIGCPAAYRPSCVSDNCNEASHTWTKDQCVCLRR